MLLLPIVTIGICMAFTPGLVITGTASPLTADEELANKRQRAEERLKREADNHRKSCQYIVVGMTKDEVRDVMGKPDYDGYQQLQYGKKDSIQIRFNDAGGVVTVENCKRS